MKKRTIKTMIITLSILLSVATTAFGYATVKFVLNKTVNQSVTVGETVKYTEGLFVELSEYDPYTLTYFEVEETDTTKHYITYTYNYQVLVDNTSIEVSSLSDDIVVSELTSTDTTISITFSLNQDKDFTSGDILNIQFYFEAVENEPININTATVEELTNIGFTISEATEIVNCTIIFTDLDNLYYNIYIVDIHTRFDSLVDSGVLTFGGNE